MSQRLARAAFVTLIALLLFTRQTLAAGVVGNGTPGSCTEAALVQALASGGSISFNCGGAATITVTQTRTITSATTIDGGGQITLSGGGRVPIFYIGQSQTLSLRNLTLRDGYYQLPSANGSDGGGAVRGAWKASLVVENCRFYNNVVVSPAASDDHGGGAIFLHTGVLLVRGSEFQGNRAQRTSGGAIHTLFSNVDIGDSRFDGNQAEGYGGAFYNDGSLGANGYIRFTRTHFTNNSGRGQGGAAFTWLYPYQSGSLVTVDTVNFSGNSITANARGDAYGGGLRHGNGPINILNTTFAANTAGKQGGGLWAGEVSRMNLSNVTFSGNRALASDGLGGAIMTAGVTSATLTNVTLSGNQAGFMGGAIWSSTPLVLRNTLVAGNTAGNPWGNNVQCGPATYQNGGGNMQWPLPSGDRACTAGVAVADPRLGPLGDNGGFSHTHALAVNSPAIDAGTNSSCPATDQRGRSRPFDGNWDGTAVCDIGAFESTSFDSPTGVNAAPYRNVYRTPTPLLEWGAVTWATGYEVQVSDSQTFRVAVYSSDNIQADTLAVTTSPLENGVYYWRVRAQRSDGSWSAWSATDSFVILPAA